MTRNEIIERWIEDYFGEKKAVKVPDLIEVLLSGGGKMLGRKLTEFAREDKNIAEREGDDRHAESRHNARDGSW